MKHLAILVFCLTWLQLHPASAADYKNRFNFVLDIFGNADMNWTIDLADLDYVRNVIDGTAVSTPYADANGDGSVDAADLSAIQAIIDGQANRLILKEKSGIKVMLTLPVNRVVTLAPWATRTMVQLGAQDSIVGIDTYTAQGSKYAGLFVFLKACPELIEQVNVGTSSEPNKEVLASLHPDMIFAGQIKGDQVKVLETVSGAPVYQPKVNHSGMDYAIENGPYENWLTLGYIFGKHGRALDIIEFCENEFKNIRARTTALPEVQRRTAWYCSGKINRGGTVYSPVLLAGGAMPSPDAPPFFGEIQLEKVLEWDPDVILVQYWPHLAGMIDEIKKDPTLSLLSAVKNDRIVFLRNGRVGYDSAFNAAETWYIAKVLYPEQFRDINVEQRVNRVLEFFYGAPKLYTWEITERPVYKTW